MARRTSKPGVYKITNLINGKFYIGSSSINVHQRWNDHKSQLNAGLHPNIHLMRSCKKYGIEVFLFEVLEYCNDVLEREQHYIDTLKPHYNIQPLARSSAGIKRRQETCDKIGLSKIGNKNRVGKSFTQEVRDQISDTLKDGYKTGRIIHAMQGKKHSAKAISKISKSKIGNSQRKDNPTYRNFKRLDKDTLKVKQEYDTARQAADSVQVYRKSASSAIIHACRTGQVAFGYRWSSSTVQVKSDELLETL